MIRKFGLLIFLPLFFLPLQAFCQNERQVVNHSNISFTLPEKDLLPENVAYDPSTETFYIGSTRKGKIVSVSRDGEIKDLKIANGPDWWMVIGMKVDVERQLLWVCSSGGSNLIDYKLTDEEEGRPAGIFKIDLNTNTLQDHYILNEPGKIHFFNDLVVLKNGDVYATHMFEDYAIYKISVKGNSLEKKYHHNSITYPNGITVSDDNQYLFVAHSNGISRINLSTDQITPISVPEGLTISGKSGFDGIYFYENSLIGIQPENRTVLQLELNIQGDSIISSQILELNHPMMNNPTTGVLVDSDFFFIANAQFDSFNQDGILFPMEKLYEPVILKLKLTR